MRLLLATRAAAIAAALLLFAPASRADGARPGRVATAEGIVLVARGSPILVEVRGRKDFVALEPGATLLGFQELRELRTGDRIRFSWSRELAGTKVAHRIEAEPYVRHEVEHVVAGAALLAALGGAERPVLLDARPRERYAAGHLPGAVSVPSDAAEREVAAALPAAPAPPVVIYGEGPRDERPGVLLRRLLAAGRSGVAVLEGGIQRWTEADLRLELTPAQASRLVAAGEPWLFVDARPPGAYAAATIPGAVSLPMDDFRWQDFDGKTPLPPIVFFGADGGDIAPVALAERIRSLRSGTSIKTEIRVAVLGGGLAAWERAGLPLERGATRRTGVPYRALLPNEISPEEFEQLWALRGGERFAFLDVRRSGHTEEQWVHRIHLEVLPQRIGELPRDRELVVFCTIGERSRVAAELLRKNGLKARFLRARTDH